MRCTFSRTLISFVSAGTRATRPPTKPTSRVSKFSSRNNSVSGSGSCSLPKASHFRRKDCRLCHSQDVQLVFALAPTPPANNFLKPSQAGEPEEKFPLDVFFCKACAHVQLLDVVDPEILFRNYVYVSGTSPVFVEHFRLYAEKLIADYSLGAGASVVEIGSD